MLSPKLLGRIFLILLFLLSLIVYLGLNKSFDRSVLILFQEITPRSLDLPFSLLSLIGAFEIVSLIFLLILAIVPRLNKIIVLLGYGIVLILEVVGKSIIPQIAPPLELLRTKAFFTFPTGQISEFLYAFPSGHSARTAFISLVLLFAIWKNPKLSKNLRLIMSFMIGLFDASMFYSRVYLAEHWTTDVIGGVLLGFVVCLILLPFLFKKNSLK